MLILIVRLVPVTSWIVCVCICVDFSSVNSLSLFNELSGEGAISISIADTCPSCSVIKPASSNKSINVDAPVLACFVVVAPEE